MAWGSNVFPLLIITSSGGFTGLFEYSPSPGTGNLILSSTASNGTDPFGNQFFQGVATYAPSGGNSLVINLLSTGAATAGFFQYNAPSGGIQGIRILSVVSASGTDPVTGTPYAAGLQGTNPVFGDNLTVVGTAITFNVIGYTRAGQISAGIGSGSTRPVLRLDAPQQTTTNHLEMLMSGESPDATVAPQLLLGVVSGSGTLTGVTGSTIETQAGSSTSSALSGVQPSLPAGSLGLDIRVSGDTAARAALTTGFTGVGPGVTTGNGTGAHDTLFTRSAAGLWVASQTAATQPGTTATAETRHAFTGANSWVVNPGFPWFYELLLSGEVRIQGAVVVPVGFASNQAIAVAVPAAYRPSYNGPIFTGWDTTHTVSIWFYMSSGGVLTTQTGALPGALVAGDVIGIPGQTYSLS